MTAPTLLGLARGLRAAAGTGLGLAGLGAATALADKKDEKDDRSRKTGTFRDTFDPEAYERAAKALKEIEKSKNAKEARARRRPALREPATASDALPALRPRRDAEVGGAVREILEVST